LQLLRGTGGPPPTIEAFNRKLTETDSYLQILINQFAGLKLEERIQNCGSSEAEREQLRSLKELSVYLLDSIKHTIVLLQIAKNVKYPVNGVPLQDISTGNSSDSSTISATNADSLGPAGNNKTNDNSKYPVTPNRNEHRNQLLSASSLPPLALASSLSEEMKEAPLHLAQLNSVSPTSLKETAACLIKSSEVPDVSYASSDDEDCFYDAREDSLAESSSSNVLSPVKEMKNIISFKSSAGDSAVSTGENLEGDVQEGQLTDYDHLYDTDSDDELDSMESHGSVISHLISQVKIGMDLTKVALPTFILERRSLLEMYADFFAHPDIFVSITDQETPQERMVQMVRWYLSAFHAGRKGSVAKKPYNPVLGEVFKCHWNLDTSSSAESAEANQCSDGPVSWAKRGDLTFIAEQVSHHPPISAFYAESIDKRIMCCAHIWTKSKFLGLSIGVNNLGQGSVYLVDHAEEYTCTFPSAYGRSILTEPWFEMGGPVEINCVQTGYYAKVEFLTKPFYGGKRHRINAEVFGPPPTKKLIVSITGEWNGVMTAKWAATGKSEIFVDTKTLPVMKKQVTPISEQEEFESRNMWKVVTAALKRQDVTEATAAKYAIEQRQRELAKEREEKSLKWQNRAFHSLTPEKWLYNNPLTNRLK
ncbi:PREDICTED: oxysterol-binding protein-related protein 9-like, partial [Rhagoletis zephyria]|uniref:oxysterol-binding protein-related protein 9-like n=1 Tax=Rhagoletis zephyria TaxID=28612 RepID=UPI000811359B